MKHQNIQKLSNEEFRRATGVKRKTFTLMIEIIKEKEVEKKKLGGRPNKLSAEDRLLMTLEYLREYRTYFHIAQSYGIVESACYKNTKAIEDILIKSGHFSLPRRKDILMNEDPIEVILIDATEHTIERPKKKRQKTVKTFKSTTILVKKDDIRLKHR